MSKWKHDSNWVASEKGVWRTELNAIFKLLLNQLGKVQVAGTVKAVHKSRVSIRRLLTLLEFLNDHTKPSIRVKAVLRTLQKSLGKMRDLDVMLLHYREETATGEILALLEILQLQRAGALLEFTSLYDNEMMSEASLKPIEKALNMSRKPTGVGSISW